MSDNPSVFHQFNVLKERVLGWDRIAGTYILEAAKVPSDVKDATEQDAFLRKFASRLGFPASDVRDVEWINAEVFREEARHYITKALVGGPAIGHSRWDVPPTDAEAFADHFLALFGGDSRFFCDAPPAGRAEMFGAHGYDYIYGGGCVAVGGELAAVFWVLDND